MPIEFYLARRYLLDRRHGAWGWIISWISILGVAIGVAALIATLSVMTGFREDIQEKLLGIQPHILISSPFGQMKSNDPKVEEVLTHDPRVKAWAPFITQQALIGRRSLSSGTFIKGIDPEKEQSVVRIGNKLEEAQWSELAVHSPKQPAIFLGKELARNIGAFKGDTVWVMVPDTDLISPLSFPKAHLFTVQGFIKTGRYDYDSNLAFITLTDAQTLFKMTGKVTAVGVRLDNAELAISYAKELQKKLVGEYWVRSWLSMEENLFSALKLEKTVMFVILILVTVVASFMIVSNLLLIITQKIKEIGILRAMGATGETIRRTFLLQGVMMGLIGNVLGVILGVAISLFLGHSNLIHLPPDVYYIDRLPVRIEAFDIAMVVVVASMIILIASLYPAHRASKLDPLDAIRYG